MKNAHGVRTMVDIGTHTARMEDVQLLQRMHDKYTDGAMGLYELSLELSAQGLVQDASQRKGKGVGKSAYALTQTMVAGMMAKAASETIVPAAFVTTSVQYAVLVYLMIYGPCIVPHLSQDACVVCSRPTMKVPAVKGLLTTHRFTYPLHGNTSLSDGEGIFDISQTDVVGILKTLDVRAMVSEDRDLRLPADRTISTDKFKRMMSGGKPHTLSVCHQCYTLNGPKRAAYVAIVREARTPADLIGAITTCAMSIMLGFVLRRTGVQRYKIDSLVGARLFNETRWEEHMASLSAPETVVYFGRADDISNPGALGTARRADLARAADALQLKLLVYIGACYAIEPTLSPDNVDCYKFLWPKKNRTNTHQRHTRVDMAGIAKSVDVAFGKIKPEIDKIPPAQRTLGTLWKCIMTLFERATEAPRSGPVVVMGSAVVDVRSETQMQPPSLSEVLSMYIPDFAQDSDASDVELQWAEERRPARNNITEYVLVCAYMNLARMLVSDTKDAIVFGGWAHAMMAAFKHMRNLEAGGVPSTATLKAFAKVGEAVPVQYNKFIAHFAHKDNQQERLDVLSELWSADDFDGHTDIITNLMEQARDSADTHSHASMWLSAIKALAMHVYDAFGSVSGMTHIKKSFAHFARETMNVWLSHSTRIPPTTTALNELDSIRAQMHQGFNLTMDLTRAIDTLTHAVYQTANAHDMDAHAIDAALHMACAASVQRTAHNKHVDYMRTPTHVGVYVAMAGLRIPVCAYDFVVDTYQQQLVRLVEESARVLFDEITLCVAMPVFIQSVIDVDPLCVMIGDPGWGMRVRTNIVRDSLNPIIKDIRTYPLDLLPPALSILLDGKRRTRVSTFHTCAFTQENTHAIARMAVSQPLHFYFATCGRITNALERAYPARASGNRFPLVRDVAVCYPSDNTDDPIPAFTMYLIPANIAFWGGQHNKPASVPTWSKCGAVPAHECAIMGLLCPLFPTYHAEALCASYKRGGAGVLADGILGTPLHDALRQYCTRTEYARVCVPSLEITALCENMNNACNDGEIDAALRAVVPSAYNNNIFGIHAMAPRKPYAVGGARGFIAPTLEIHAHVVCVGSHTCALLRALGTARDVVITGDGGVSVAEKVMAEVREIADDTTSTAWMNLPPGILMITSPMEIPNAVLAMDMALRSAPTDKLFRAAVEAGLTQDRTPSIALVRVKTPHAQSPVFSPRSSASPMPQTSGRVGVARDVFIRARRPEMEHSRKWRVTTLLDSLCTIVANTRSGVTSVDATSMSFMERALWYVALSMPGEAHGRFEFYVTRLFPTLGSLVRELPPDYIPRHYIDFLLHPKSSEAFVRATAAFGYSPDLDMGETEPDKPARMRFAAQAYMRLCYVAIRAGPSAHQCAETNDVQWGDECDDHNRFAEAAVYCDAYVTYVRRIYAPMPTIGGIPVSRFPGFFPESTFRADTPHTPFPV